ncbi:MAG: polysaccharide deacetylase family protein [Clostridia bacterium]|nr:polysaccharide deacetylase family protein [Clostridia bacterium]
MKHVTALVLAAIFVLTLVYAVYSLADPVPDTPPVTKTPAITTAPITETETAPQTTAPLTSEITTVTVTETAAPDEATPETVPPVTTTVTTTTGTTGTTAPPPPPIDYSDLAGEYGFAADVDPNRTWAEMVRTGRQIDPSRPMLALTFDDGPGPHTDRLLEILGENGAKATFFVVGSRLSGREEILRRMASEGHEIGGHSWWHSDLRTLSERAAADELMMTRQQIFAASGADSRIVRPPYGAHDEFVRWVAESCGIAFVNWSVDTLDWKNRNADAVYNAVVGGAYDGAVILLHDIHGTTVDAMERAIPQLIADGYQLVTVSEMMAASGKDFVPGAVYNKK